MKMKLFWLFAFSVLMQYAGSCQGAWTLKKDKNGIKVFSRKTTAFKFDEVKVECEFEGRISQLAAVLLDINRQKEWSYKTSKSELIKAVSPTDLIFYTEIESPWPYDNRYMVVRMIIKQNMQTKEMTVEAKNVDDNMPAKKNLVKIKYSNATWKVTPVAGNKYRIEYRLQVDPGDGVPAWLLNVFAVNGPYESFVNLKQKIKQPQYAQVKLPFIVD